VNCWRNDITNTGFLVLGQSLAAVPAAAGEQLEVASSHANDSAGLAAGISRARGLSLVVLRANGTVAKVHQDLAGTSVQAIATPTDIAAILDAWVDAY